jgi:hypothetical protein
MATGVNFMIFEKSFFSEFNDVSHVGESVVPWVHFFLNCYFLYRVEQKYQILAVTF